MNLNKKNEDYIVENIDKKKYKVMLKKEFLEANKLNHEDIVLLFNIHEYELEHVTVNDESYYMFEVKLSLLEIRKLIKIIETNESNFKTNKKDRSKKVKFKDEKNYEIIGNKKIDFEKVIEQQKIEIKKLQKINQKNTLLELREKYIIDKVYEEVITEYDIPIQAIEKIIKNNCTKKEDISFKIDEIEKYLINKSIAHSTKEVIKSIINVFELHTDQKNKFIEVDNAIKIIEKNDNIINYLKNYNGKIIFNGSAKRKNKSKITNPFTKLESIDSKCEN